MLEADLTLSEREEIALKIARRIHKFKLETIAIVFFESVKPLSFIGSQIMYFINPLAGLFVDIDQYERLSAFFEDKSNIEILLRKIEDYANKKGEVNEQSQEK